MVTEASLSTEEMSLLMYLELRVSDHGGKIRMDLMMPWESDKLRQWHAENLIELHELPLSAAQEFRASHLVVLTETAWLIVLRERRRRADKAVKAMFAELRPYYQRGF